MKADNDQGICDQCHKDDAKAFHCQENILDCGELNSRTDKHILNGIIEGKEIRVAGVNEKGNPDSDTVFMHCSARKGDSFENNLDCYINKSVMECCKNGTVKDICIDEGVPLHEKFLIDDGVDETDTGTDDSIKSEELNAGFLSIRAMETEKAKAKHSKICSGEVEEQAENPIGLECDSKCLILKKEANDATPGKPLESDRCVSDVSGSLTNVHAGEGHDGRVTAEITEKDLTMIEENNVNLSRGSNHELIEQSYQDSTAASSDKNGVSGSGDMNATLINACLVSASQEPLKEVTQISSSEHHELKNKLFEEHTNGSNIFQTAFGETSFSVSGLITYSGPIAYSGSLSRRSDSSTTSTRSFAFPVLQSEWNSSPVRMARADRRNLRRQKGWRQTLLCCRF